MKRLSFFSKINLADPSLSCWQGGWQPHNCPSAQLLPTRFAAYLPNCPSAQLLPAWLSAYLHNCPTSAHTIFWSSASLPNHQPCAVYLAIEWSSCLHICSYARLLVCPSASLPICLSARLPICLSISPTPSIFPSLCLIHMSLPVIIIYLMGSLLQFIHCVNVCVCVCVREREREWVCVRVRVCEWISVRVREWVRVCVSAWVCVCLGVWVCARVCVFPGNDTGELEGDA